MWPALGQIKPNVILQRSEKTEIYDSEIKLMNPSSKHSKNNIENSSKIEKLIRLWILTRFQNFLRNRLLQSTWRQNSSKWGYVHQKEARRTVLQKRSSTQCTHHKLSSGAKITGQSSMWLYLHTQCQFRSTILKFCGSIRDFSISRKLKLSVMKEILVKTER